MKLLICDDDISTVGVLEHQIPWVSLGISRILQAYNGEAAIQIAVTEKPELIICDIGMPRKNGLDVLKYIRQQGLDSEFCFLTCYDDFACAKEAIRYGVSAYLTKPFELEEVEQAVREMIVAHRKKAQPARSFAGTAWSTAPCGRSATAFTATLPHPLTPRSGAAALDFLRKAAG